MSYSGETSFKFSIERFKSRDSGNYFTHDTVPVEDDFEYEPEIISLAIEGHAYYDSGNRYGSNDDCYDEDGGTEITSCLGPNNEDWEDKLTKEEKESILEMIADEVAG